jgi:hypothetical protein
MDNITKTTNPDGFPVVPCDRCNGTGKFSWNERDRDRCLACNGQAYRVAPNARKAYNAFLDAKAIASHKPAHELSVGDQVIHRHGTRRTRTTVTAIAPSTVSPGYVAITLAIGMTLHMAPEGWDTIETVIDFDPAPFLATIKAGK